MIKKNKPEVHLFKTAYRNIVNKIKIKRKFVKLQLHHFEVEKYETPFQDKLTYLYLLDFKIAHPELFLLQCWYTYFTQYQINNIKNR